MSESTSNKFLKHFTIIGTGTVINLVIGLLTTPLITRVVNPVEYGQLSIFTMYEGIIVMVLCLGLDQALVRWFYDYDTLEYRRALLFHCVTLPVFVCCVFSVIVIALSATGIISFEFSTAIIVMLCLYSLCGIIYRFSQLLVRLSYQTKLYSSLNIIQKVSYVCIALVFLFTTQINDFNILAFATLLSYFVCMTISILAQRNMWMVSKNDSSKCFVSQKELLKYSYPYIFSMGIINFFQAIDKISLNYYCTYTEVGIYSSTMTLVHIFAIIQTTFNTLWAPMAVEHYSKDKEDRSFYQKGNKIITVVMFFIGLSLILCKDLFALLLGEKYREAAYILPFLIFNPIMYTISETTVSGLVFKKKSSMQVVVAAVSCVVNLIGNTILVPNLGCQGAAISTGLSYIIFFTMRTFLSNRYFKVDFKLGKFYLLTAVTAAYALYNTFISFNMWSIVGYVICIITMYLLYKDTVIWGIKYLIEFSKNLLQTKRKNV